MSMNKFDIIYLITMCALCGLCLLSYIFVAAFGSNRSKTVFAVLAGVSLLVAITAFVMLNVPIDFYPAMRLYEIRGEALATVPDFALAILASGEIAGLLHSLKRKRKVASVSSSAEAPENVKYPQIDNVRKAGAVLHENYRIVRGDR